MTRTTHPRNAFEGPISSRARRNRKPSGGMVIMRALIVIAGAVLLIGSSAYAGGDKSQNAMVDASSQNGGSNGFTNGTTAAKIKSGKCLLSGGIKGLTGFADGDIAICIGSATVLGTPLGPNTPLGNAAIIRAVVKAG